MSAAASATAPAAPPRRAGILLHPTSLPGPFGIGDLGPEAERFLRWTAAAGLRVWQVLPLGPPAYAGAPYTALSSFALNPALISPEKLRDDGLLSNADLAAAAGRLGGSPEQVDFGRVEQVKTALLWQAWRNFQERARQSAAALARDFHAFENGAAQAGWLHAWALFATSKARHGGRSWEGWDPKLAHREPSALTRLSAEAGDELAFHRFVQFLADRQWRELRATARALGIALMGDVPIYAAYDSADVWSRPELFDLDRSLRPRHVAGVPPDYFSKFGQRWGNPLYRWDAMAADLFRWWVERLRAGLRLADMLRLDHFRGFAGYWQIPAKEKTAVKGRWVPGPGRALFAALEKALGALPLVAEDLGEITDDVHVLRRACGLPGMRVLQFGFGAEPGPHTPHRIGDDMVVYTGTHDNATARGWYRGLAKADKERFLLYAGGGSRDPARVLIRLALTSAAQMALFPAQDILELDDRARMNTPGTSRGNWTWRLRPGQLDHDHAARLRRMVEVSERA